VGFISFQKEKIISWPTVNRNSMKEAEPLPELPKVMAFELFPKPVVVDE